MTTYEFPTEVRFDAARAVTFDHLDSPQPKRKPNDVQDDDEDSEGDEGDAQASVRPRFGMVAYTGAPVFGGSMVFDLGGLKPAGERMPALLDHDPSEIAGQIDEFQITENGLELAGDLYPDDTNAGRKVATLSSLGFVWQASARFAFGEGEGRAEFLDEGEFREVNGQQFDGPGLVVLEATVREASFTSLGADAATSAEALSDQTLSYKSQRKGAPVSEPTTSDPMKLLAELQAAFPDDPGFVLEQIRLGATVEQAQAAHNAKKVAELEAKLKEKESIQAETERKLNEALARVSNQRSPVSLGVSHDDGDSSKSVGELIKDRWDKAVQAQLAAGKDRWKAVRAAAIANPELHRAYVLKYNEGRITPHSFRGAI